jgi:hypothetical protein
MGKVRYVINKRMAKCVRPATFSASHEFEWLEVGHSVTMGNKKPTMCFQNDSDSDSSKLS